MARRTDAPDFVEAIARGLDVIKAFGPHRPVLTLSEVAAAAGLARPTARRILLTLEALGYARGGPAGFSADPAGARARHGVRAVARACGTSPGRTRSALVARIGESSSIAQLDGSDIVYVARVAVPKIIALRVDIGTRFPAPSTSLGKVLLAGLPAGRAGRGAGRAVPVGRRRRGTQPDRAELDELLRDVRAKGWALTDEALAPGIRSVAAPLRDGAGRVFAAMNVTVHAAETSVATLTGDYLPLLLQTAGEVSADFARCQSVPVAQPAG